MGAGALQGLLTAVLIIAFIAICAWAYSSRRKKKFDAAARLPLEEDNDTKESP